MKRVEFTKPKLVFGSYLFEYSRQHLGQERLMFKIHSSFDPLIHVDDYF